MMPYIMHYILKTSFFRKFIEGSSQFHLWAEDRMALIQLRWQLRSIAS